MPEKPIIIDLNELASALSQMDDREGINVKVVETKIVIAALGKHLRGQTTERAMATVAAIAERAGL